MLATSTVFRELGWDDGVLTKVVALVVVAALVVGAGIAGFDVIMRLQTGITVITAVLTVVYIVLAAPSIDLGAIAALPAGSGQQVVGALVLVMTGFGLGWVNAAADYSRDLPRASSTGGVVWWTTFGGALAPAILVVTGALLAGSSKDLSSAIGTDPIGAPTTLLPVWFLIPFAVVAILGLVGGAVLDIYSSGLALLSAGVRIPRPVAAGVDGVSWWRARCTWCSSRRTSSVRSRRSWYARHPGRRVVRGLRRRRRAASTRVRRGRAGRPSRPER